jgi:hypothetical protein
MLARSPDRKRAAAYLAASGAAAISITKSGEHVCSIHTGSKLTKSGQFISTWWTAAAMAPEIASRARQELGDSPDVAEATAAVLRSAASLRASLTDDATAISRAAASMIRLDAMLKAMNRDGTLREFNRQYKSRRDAALADGRGFMNYAVAMSRLKLALVPMLAAGRPLRGVFEEVFR